MKKKELLPYLDSELLDKLFGFCYARTRDSYEAEELFSDILYALLKSAEKDGEITQIHPYIWRVARNVYADFSEKKRHAADTFADGDNDDLLSAIPDDTDEDDTDELLTAVYRRIAFLTRAYRDVMILYYLEGMPITEIARRQNTTENAIRQRLFAARQKIRNEVDEMTEATHKPVALDPIDYVIWGNGSPDWGDPRNVCTRMFSKHVLRLCLNKPMSAAEIAGELNVPTLYVEEELEILRKGENGKYGLLRRLENGKYALNFILLEKDVIEEAHALYIRQLPMICDSICDYILTHKSEYLTFPYRNRKPEWNLILWQQLPHIVYSFSAHVEQILKESYFADIPETDRPFTVFGYVYNGKEYGGGWDGVDARNVCGYSEIHLDNIYITRIKKHFSCGLNVAKDPKIQLAIRAVDGLDIASLSEEEKEHAAKAIECGYLYREGETLYTKVLVNSLDDRDRLFAISKNLHGECFMKDARIVAERIAAMIRRSVPEYLLGEWRRANDLAYLPILDAVAEILIEKGFLTPPPNGIGAEGCWIMLRK